MTQDCTGSVEGRIGVVEEDDGARVVNRFHEEGVACGSSEMRWAGVIESVVEADRSRARFVCGIDELSQNAAVERTWAEPIISRRISKDNRQGRTRFDRSTMAQPFVINGPIQRHIRGGSHTPYQVCGNGGEQADGEGLERDRGYEEAP